MIYIWLDESDRHGEFYSNFYGGILIPSRHHREVLERMRSIVEVTGIKDEVKWQKVNDFHYEKYLHLVDELFDMAKEDNLKSADNFSSVRFSPCL